MSTPSSWLFRELLISPVCKLSVSPGRTEQPFVRARKFVHPEPVGVKDVLGYNVRRYSTKKRYLGRKKKFIQKRDKPCKLPLRLRLQTSIQMVIIPCNFRHPGSGEMQSLSPLAKGVAECGKETNTRFCIFLRATKRVNVWSTSSFHFIT